MTHSREALDQIENDTREAWNQGWEYHERCGGRLEEVKLACPYQDRRRREMFEAGWQAARNRMLNSHD